MINLDKKPNYYNIVTNGTYDNHEFTIHDTDKGIFIMFRDHYKEGLKDFNEFNSIKEEIKRAYFTNNPNLDGNKYVGWKYY